MDEGVIGFSTPEEAALGGGWPPAAKARVLAVDRNGEDSADVLVDTIPSFPLVIHCARRDGLWFEIAYD